VIDRLFEELDGWSGIPDPSVKDFIASCTS